jgi:hypothetical protein
VSESLTALYWSVWREVTAVSRLVDWAEDEVARAVGRWPAEADRLFRPGWRAS